MLAVKAQEDWWGTGEVLVERTKMGELWSLLGESLRESDDEI